jgi:hypothetical protein
VILLTIIQLDAFSSLYVLSDHFRANQMSVSRVRRDVIQYATHGGQEQLKQRPLSSFAPALSASQASKKTSNAGPKLSSGVLEFLRKAAALQSAEEKGAAKVTGGVLKVVESLVQPSSAGHTLRRVVLKSQRSRFDALAIAALSLGEMQGLQAKATALLCVVSSDELARKAAAHLTTVHGLPPPTILDGAVRLPPSIAAPARDAEGAISPLAVVLATPAALLAIDKRSSVWKQLHFMMIDVSDEKFLSAEAQADVEKVGHTLACERVVIAAATADAAVLPRLAWLLPEKGSQMAIAMQTKKQFSRPSLDVKYIVAEGHTRFVHLFTLCSNQSRTLRITVRVSTPQVALFLTNIFYALKFDGGRIFCDSEPSIDGTAASKIDHGPLVEEIDKLSDGVGCVLFTAFGLVPASGSVFVQFDPMLDIANMCSEIADRLTPGVAAPAAVMTPTTPAAKPVAASSVKSSKRPRTPPPTPVTASPHASFSIPQPAQANYRHIIVFFNSNEVGAGVPLLRATGQRYNIQFSELSPPRGPTVVLTLGKMSSLQAKLFTIQQEAYEAYRASMNVYARLQPTTVYDVQKVSLQKVAEQFGYEEPPLLDLRTKATAFRPKEDYFKAAVRRLKSDRRAFKSFAAAHIIGEGPEEDPDLS